MVDSKLQEIMLKNIWEIENNPVFNSLSSNNSQINIQPPKMVASDCVFSPVTAT